MCSILVILFLHKKMIPEHKTLKSLLPDDLCYLFDMLCLFPKKVDDSQWVCEELSVIFNFIPDEVYGELATCLEYFINWVIESESSGRQSKPSVRQSKPSVLEQLHVIPLIHVFRKKIVFSDSIPWEDDNIKLHVIKHILSLQQNKRYNTGYLAQ